MNGIQVKMLLRKGKSNFFALSSMDYPYLVPNTDPFTFWYRKYELLNISEFNSSRRWMSVLVKEPEGRILFLSKGADRLVLYLR